MRRIPGWLVLCLALMITAAWAVPAWAVEAVVTRKDGRQFKGELVAETPEAVTLLIANIPTVIKRDDISSIQKKASAIDQFKAKRKELTDENIPGRLALVKELLADEPSDLNKREQVYLLAQSELASLAKLVPDNREIALRARIVNAQLDQIKRAKAAAAENVKPPVEPIKPAVGPGVNPVAGGPLPKERMGEKDINLIRLYEYSFKDRNKPTVVIPPDVINDMFEKYRDNELVPKGAAAQVAFKRKKGWEQLDVLFQLRARDLWSQAIVRGDPQAMRTFKTKVHRNYVLNYCGSNQCHGGATAPGLFLFRVAPTSDATVYANFYILHRYENKAGFMIDRDFPDRSLVLQYGLPRADASTPHPDVPGWRPALLRGTKDPDFVLVRDWIANELYRPKPTYPVEFQAPQLPKPKAEPAEDPPAKGAAAPAPAAPAKR